MISTSEQAFPEIFDRDLGLAGDDRSARLGRAGDDRSARSGLADDDGSAGAPLARTSRETSLQDRLLSAHRELLVLARENARRARMLEQMRRELAAALDQLHACYWHIERMQEVLPLCLDCGRVYVSDQGWQDLAEYLRHRSLFLSHGYCPDCDHRLRARLGLPRARDR